MLYVMYISISIYIYMFFELYTLVLILLVGTSWNTGPHGENPTELSLDGTLRNYLMKKAAAHEAGRCPSLETEKKVGESQFLGMSQMYVHYM